MQQAGNGVGVVMQKLFLFLLVLLGIWYVRKALRRGAQNEVAHDRPRPSAGAAPHTENIRECSYCSVLIPESEGIVVDGQFYCSPEHAAAQGKRGS